MAFDNSYSALWYSSLSLSVTANRYSTEVYLTLIDWPYDTIEFVFVLIESLLEKPDLTEFESSTLPSIVEKHFSKIDSAWSAYPTLS